MRTSQKIGKDFEKTLGDVFSALQKSYGFRAHVFVDSHAAGNMVAGQPADYLVARVGELFFLEAKASMKNARMTRSALQPSQRGAILSYGQMLGIPYVILFHNEQDGTVHIIDGAEFMRGQRTDYKSSLLAEVPLDTLPDALVEMWSLQPLVEVLNTFRSKFGESL